MEPIKKLISKHQLLGLCFLLSIVLLAVILLFQYSEFSGLKLDVKWLIVSAIPIVFGLFIGEYIKSFKGFGIEIEASLKAEIPQKLTSPLTESVILNDFGIDKRSITFLVNMDDRQRSKITRLRFVLSRRNYYEGSVGMEKP